MKTGTMPSALARDYWRALLDNAARLIEDAVLLSDASPARARSLLVLAREEPAKALWLYELASDAWTQGLDVSPMPAGFFKDARKHVAKLMESHQQGMLLGPFWRGEIPDPGPGFPTKEEAVAALTDFFEALTGRARSSDKEKQAGFYVDLDLKAGMVSAPAGCEVADLTGEISHVAAIVEMHLIEDHSRMKASNRPYDSTHDIQNRLVLLAHPDLDDADQ